jgi:hypothetical protein
MPVLAAMAGSALLAMGHASAVPPPTAPGAWHQLGAAMTSRPGKGLHFFRTAISPQGLGIVVTSSSSRPIRGFWASWCAISDDDGPVEELRGAFAGTKTVIAYPHVLDGATVCYLWVNTTAPGPASRTAAAEFVD